MNVVFRTRPLLVEKIWGGRRLQSLLGKELPPSGVFGESWEVSDLPGANSTVATGPLQGETLEAAVARYGTDLVGTAAPDGRFPLLVKLLDARADLSIQVHPGPEHLATRPGARSKDECWLVLDASADSSIIHGFRQDTDRQVFRDAVEQGRALDHLLRVPVKPGDVFRVPPGTIHAICAGVVLLEIQQPSDTTYRVFDYRRPGLDGRLRELHLEDALEVAAFRETLPEDRGTLAADGEQWQTLANVSNYRIERYAASDELSWEVSPHTAQIVHVLRGECRLNDVPLAPGDSAVVPASTGRVWVTEPSNCEFVVAGLGGEPLMSGIG